MRNSALLGLFAVLLSACSIGGSDSSATPVATEAGNQTATADVTATAMPPAATSTPAVSPTSTTRPTATATASPTASPTITPSPSPTVDMVEAPFGGITRPESTLPNYTVAYTAEFTGGGATEDGTIDLLIEQSAPDAYHMLIQSNRAGASLTEYWFVGGRAFFRGADGAVFEVTGAADPSTFSPSAFLITVPSAAQVPQAVRVGPETVESRETTHYSVAAEHAAGFAAPQDGGGVNDPEGELEIWVDNELNFVVQMLADLSWTDDAGTQQTMVIDYRVSKVNSTPQINPPI